MHVHASVVSAQSLGPWDTAAHLDGGGARRLADAAAPTQPKPAGNLILSRADVVGCSLCAHEISSTKLMAELLSKLADKLHSRSIFAQPRMLFFRSMGALASQTAASSLLRTSGSLTLSGGDAPARSSHAWPAQVFFGTLY